MKFLTEEIRREFHLLPCEIQLALINSELSFNERDMEFHILLVDNEEISLRIEPMAKGVCPLLSKDE